MKKISSLIAFLAFLATAVGLLVAVISYLDRKCGLFCDENCDDMPYGGQEYYSEDLSFDPQNVQEPVKGSDEAEVEAEPETEKAE